MTSSVLCGLQEDKGPSSIKSATKQINPSLINCKNNNYLKKNKQIKI